MSQEHIQSDSSQPATGPNFSAPFIRRPVATFLLSAAILIAGSVAYKLLPVASLPQVEFPVISIGASLPGADPDTMASAVATPHERQFSRIAGVNQMTSSSSLGSVNITLQFDLNRDVNGAARDVQAALCARGVGVAVLPTLVGDSLPDVHRLDLGEEPPGRDTWIGYHRDLRRLARLRALLDLVFARLAN